MASFLKDEMPWFKHAKLDHMSKKEKKKKKGHSDDVRHKGKRVADGEGQV